MLTLRLDLSSVTCENSSLASDYVELCNHPTIIDYYIFLKQTFTESHAYLFPQTGQGMGGGS